MTLSEFKDSIKLSSPPPSIDPLLKSLWYDAKGNWNDAHNVAQDIHSKNGSWIHAYLHRKEGDLGNASYWYHRADKLVPKTPLEEEWEDITRALLE
ncbi:MAG: hypothetical protein ABIS36_03040 [Chryseolinea sp.]